MEKKEMLRYDKGKRLIERKNIMTPTMEKKRLIGQRIALGFSGSTLTEDFKRLVKEYKVGNVILFRENLLNRNQAKELCKEIHQLILTETGYPPFITIDQEGGMVTRLPEDMINVPGAMALAASGEVKNAFDAALLTAGELREIGVNFNLAPVLDVNSNPQNPVIGVRSYGTSPQKVKSFALETIKAYENTGVLCCGKHFPGHGDTAVDSHLALPLIDSPMESLKKMELAPFQAAIDGGIPAIMTTHILFPQLEEERIPATMSRKIITDLLKNQMGFKGLVLSDGMEMNAIKEEYTTPVGCVKAIAAGVDIVFVCHDVDLMEKSIQAVTKAFEENHYNKEEFIASVEKILSFKEKSDQAFRSPFPTPFPSLPKAKEENAALMKKTLVLAGNPLSPLGNRPFFIGPLAYRSTIASTPADTSLAFAPWFGKELQGKDITSPLNPTKEEISNLIKGLQTKPMTHLVIATYNGHLNQGQIDLANELVDLGKEKKIPVTVIALRNPYDLPLVSKEATKIAAFEYSINSFYALKACLQGEFIPTGKLDISL